MIEWLVRCLSYVCIGVSIVIYFYSDTPSLPQTYLHRMTVTIQHCCIFSDTMKVNGDSGQSA